jgi:hypothetical protein
MLAAALFLKNSSMHSFVLIFCYGFFVLAALCGWGWVLSKILFKNGKSDPGWSVGLGLAFTVIAGGVLNMVSGISSWVLIIFCLLGLIGFLFYLIFNRKEFAKYFLDGIQYGKNNKLVVLTVAFLFILILLKYSLAVSPGAFNPADDYGGYFVFPVKMMQTGHLGSDPFSERRIISSLGGQSFLDTFSLAVGQPKNLHLFDMGICFLGFLLALVGLLKQAKLETKYIILILFIAALVPGPIANITAIYSALILFVMLIRFFYSSEKTGLSNVILLALVVAALCSLKNSLAPVCGFLAVAYFLSALKQYTDSKKKFFTDAGIFLSATIIFLLPWMLASYWSSGTLFYPLLGKGFHGSVYGTFLTPTSHINFGNFLTLAYAVQNLLFFILALLVGLFIWDKSFRKMAEKEDIYLALVGILGIVVLAVATAGYAVDRYSFVFLLPIILILLTRFFQKAENGGAVFNGKSYSFLCLLLLGMLAGWGSVSFLATEKTDLDFLSFGIHNREIVSPAEALSYKNLQNSVPPGQTMLVRMDYNFLFDFKRNTVYIADYPGGSSLPPGMPAFKGPEPLADYLLAHSIRYVAYSYWDQAAFARADFQNRLDPSMNAWIRTEAQNAFDYQDNMDALGATRKRIFDDGKNFVLDLSVKVKFN